jgi:uncharacterized protein YidB (DUF937 family)
MSLLDGILGGQQSLGGLLGGFGGMQQRHGISPLALAVIGTLAYRNLKNKGGLAGLLSGQQTPQAPAANDPGTPSLLSPTVLSEGLSELLAHFRQNGQGDKAESWVAQGANKQVTPAELEQVLGAERIQWLTQQTGLEKQELLDHLAEALPHAVDKLTPDGHVPNASEAQRLM